MIRLGLRLGVGGGRRSVVLAMITVVAVGLGTTLLLLALSVIPALQARADRTAWMDESFGTGSGVNGSQTTNNPHTTVRTGVDHYSPPPSTS